MREQLKLPIGIESFSKIRTSGFYYVDKTRLIEQLLKNPSEVNLFTRPRRFGKSLNMSMLQNFFEIGCNKMLFDGLDIFQNTALCDAYMGQFPVISITLKGVDGQTYADAVAAMKDIIGMEAARFPFLAESTNLTDTEKDLYRGYVQVENGIFSMPNEALPAALRNISLLLAKHFQKEVIILIDEYDVPLAKAFENGYYEQMIFQDYVNVFPENYWINTSSNDAVKKFIQMSDNLKTKREIETLLAGGEIIKEIHQELIYPEMYQSLENVWSLLFMTGYLTQRHPAADSRNHTAGCHPAG